MSSQWLIYALGGGMGHLNRSLALARKAAQRGIHVRILSNSRFTSRCVAPSVGNLLQLESGIEVVPLPSEASKTKITKIICATLCSPLSPAFDVLVVDTFPRGLAGELTELLPLIRATKVLVHRDLHPEYVRWAKLETFVSQYDLLLVPGEDAPLAAAPRAVRTPPWLLCEPHELLHPHQARAALGIPAGNDLPVVVVSGSGKPEESILAAQMANEIANRFKGIANVRCATLDANAAQVAGELAFSKWPLLMVLPGVDLIVGAGGYNTVYEARATCTPLIAVAQQRLYDRQQQRLLSQERALDWIHAQEMVGKFLQRNESKFQ